MNTFDYICVGVARTIAAAGKFTAAAAVACCHGLAYGFAAAKNILECCVSKCERLFAWAIILTIVWMNAATWIMQLSLNYYLFCTFLY